MLDILLKISDLILPPPPSVLLLRSEKSDGLLPLLSPNFLPSNIIALSNFKSPKISATITANKFHNYKRASELLSVMFETWFITLPTRPTYLVPIPLGPMRQKERGYNQVKRVLEFSNHPSVIIFELLKKEKDTKPQTALTRQERLSNVKNIFTVRKMPTFKAGARVIICDDVTTTGATLNEARATLAPHLPKDCELICLAFAH